MTTCLIPGLTTLCNFHQDRCWMAFRLQLLCLYSDKCHRRTGATPLPWLDWPTSRPHITSTLQRMWEVHAHACRSSTTLVQGLFIWFPPPFYSTGVCYSPTTSWVRGGVRWSMKSQGHTHLLSLPGSACRSTGIICINTELSCTLSKEGLSTRESRMEEVLPLGQSQGTRSLTCEEVWYQQCLVDAVRSTVGREYDLGPTRPLSSDCNLVSEQALTAGGGGWRNPIQCKLKTLKGDSEEEIVVAFFNFFLNIFFDYFFDYFFEYFFEYFFWLFFFGVFFLSIFYRVLSSWGEQHTYLSDCDLKQLIW